MRILRKKRKIQLFDVVNTLLVLFATFLILYPLYFCVIASFSKPSEIALGNVVMWVKGFTLDTYKFIFKENQLWVGYRNTIIYTVLGTLYNLALTIPAAYVLSKRYLPMRKGLNLYFFLTMYIGGGLIPMYFLVKGLGLLDNPLSQIIGVGVSYYNLVITKRYFDSSISQELYDAAYVDGATEWRILIRIVLPLSAPIMATIGLFRAVALWNSYFAGIVYIRDRELWPVQLVLREIILAANTSMLEAGGNLAELDTNIPTISLQYASLLVVLIPIMCVYPFLQRYFAKGVMLGAVKG